MENNIVQICYFETTNKKYENAQVNEEIFLKNDQNQRQYKIKIDLINKYTSSVSMKNEINYLHIF